MYIPFPPPRNDKECIEQIKIMEKRIFWHKVCIASSIIFALFTVMGITFMIALRST